MIPTWLNLILLVIGLIVGCCVLRLLRRL